LIDLHTHILHGIDDGAQTIEDSIALLQEEQKDGVHTIALTPHFRIDEENPADFIKKRKNAFRLLSKQIERSMLPIHIILGAEVAYTPNLLNIELLDELCFENTKTILIELPMYNSPSFLNEVFYQLQLKGYTQIIANAETYT
jgi:protein-tyrosine phosphatase